MEYQSYSRHGYHVLKFSEDLVFGTHLGELEDTVMNLLGKGITKIALAFTRHSMLYSKNVAVLVKCLEIIKDRGGELVIVGPSDSFKTALQAVHFEDLAKVCDTEEELATA